MTMQADCKGLGALLQDLQRVLANRLPLVATCADELAAMQCAALSCLGALLTAHASLQHPVNDSKSMPMKDEGKPPILNAHVKD